MREFRSTIMVVTCCAVVLLAAAPVQAAPTGIGIYQNGTWYLDANRSWDWNGTPTDILGTFGVGLTGAIPVVGDWNGDGKSEIGVYIDGIWYLDMNGNWQWDGEGVDVRGTFGVGLTGAIPVVGDWNGDGKSKIGVYIDGIWYLDLNGNWQWDGEGVDVRGVFGVGLANAVPVTGDWNGDGITEIGIYSNGYWYLDKNRSWDWNGTPTDTFGIFGIGLPNAIPVTGDWNGDGITKIGVYSEGNWYLDTNASWQWDGIPTDTYGLFGVGLGNVTPVTGRWTALDTIPPTVISKSPSSGATGIAINALITATFSEAIDPSSINTTTFILTDGGTQINCTVSYMGRTATLKPSSSLASFTTYTVSLTTGVKDLSGNTIVSTVSWSFTTTSTPMPSGSLDATFGSAGTVTVSFGGAEEEARAIVLQPDGKAVVGGFADVSGIRKFALLRFNTDGVLDSTFGSGGKVVTTFASSSWDIINALAVQGDGKIVAAGGYSSYALARYNTDGSLDTGFGSGGTVRTSAGISQSTAYSVAVQSDGKIIAGGWSDQYSPYGARFTLIRYNSDGSLDTTFGSGGISKTLVGGYSATIRSIVAQPDGKIVAAGYAYTGLTYDFAFVRFNTDGSTDTSFGTSGAVILPVGTGDDVCSAVGIEYGGLIVAVGETMVSTSGDFAIVRLTAEGGLDSSFGSSGQVKTDFGGDNRAYGLAIQSDGRFIAAGFAFNQGFALARYNGDGSLDSTFGSGGKVATNSGGLALAYAVAIQNDGKIVAAGISSTGSKDFAVARFWP